MDSHLGWRETLWLTSMLFGLFFGAGNLIFPVSMGQMAGSNTPLATIGFLITAVGLPILAVISFGLTHSPSLLALSSRVNRGFGYFFTCALYMAIGPCFAIPRCFTVPFEVGAVPLLPQGAARRPALLVFSLVFFAFLLFFSLRPKKIMTWVGKLLNPLFLLTMGILIVTAILRPMGGVSSVAPSGAYVNVPVAKGFLEGYNTLDALAGLAFGIVVVGAIHTLGVTEPDNVAKDTAKAGIGTGILMSVIYILVAWMGAQSRGRLSLADNGGAALGMIADFYYTDFGAILLALIVFFCCLKTDIGLVTSISEAFVDMFPNVKWGYRGWALIFSISSLVVANFGLGAIITVSLPVLMFLYPLAITQILLALFGRKLKEQGMTYKLITLFTGIAAIFDFLNALPASWKAAAHLDNLVTLASKVLPFFPLGLGWVLPALIGLGVGLVLDRRKAA